MVPSHTASRISSESREIRGGSAEKLGRVPKKWCYCDQVVAARSKSQRKLRKEEVSIDHHWREGHFIGNGHRRDSRSSPLESVEK